MISYHTYCQLGFSSNPGRLDSAQLGKFQLELITTVQVRLLLLVSTLW